MRVSKSWCWIPFALFVACGDDGAPSDAGTDAGADVGTAEDMGTSADATTADAMMPDAGPADTGQPDAGAFMPGDPIAVTADQWTWVDFPESRCMDDSPTGLGINVHPSNTENVLVFLMGGNACFNVSTCQVTFNTDGYGSTKFATEPVLAAPIFDRNRGDNIFRDYSFVFVPYCTGDIHAGTNPSGMVQQNTFNFHGYKNVGEYLKRLVPTFSGATNVVLSGISAGGFGAMVNFDQVQTAFGSSVRVTLLNDSGPPMGNEYVAPCLQAYWRLLWGFDGQGPLGACPDCGNDPQGSFIEPYMSYLLDKYGDRNFMLISSSADSTIRTFWSYGNDNCSNLLPGVIPGNFPAARFEAGLADLRSRLLHDNAKLYMPISQRHVWLGDAPEMVMHHGVTLSDWIEAAIDDTAGFVNVPAQ